MTPYLTLSPTRGGWQLESSPGLVAPALSELALPSGTEKVELVLPTRLALFEWIDLPSTDPSELEAMTELQMEKRLPYPLEETRYAYRVLCTTPAETEAETEGEEITGAESRVFAAAFHRDKVNTLAESLIATGHPPERVSFQALRVGEALGEAVGEGVAAAAWWEEEALVFGVFEHGAPLLVELFETAAQLGENATRLLMAATVAGGSAAPEALWIDKALQDELTPLAPLLAGLRSQTPRVLPAQLPSRFPNLVLPEWQTARQRQERRQRALHGAKVAGVAAIGIVAAGFGLLAWKQQSLKNMEAELDALRPGMESLLITQTRWNALAPAIDPSRFSVELLHQVTAQLPSEKVRVTSFSHTPAGFQIEGEAPSAGEAVAFAEKLQATEAIQRFTLETPPPTLLAGERAQFVIRGK